MPNFIRGKKRKQPLFERLNFKEDCDSIFSSRFRSEKGGRGESDKIQTEKKRRRNCELKLQAQSVPGSRKSQRKERGNLFISHFHPIIYGGQREKL